MLATVSALSRRTLIGTGVAFGATQFGPAIIKARGEQPIRIGFIDPLTGAGASLAQSERDGALLAVDEINQSGGILGRNVELLIEDSALDVGIGVQKTLKLINRDRVDAIIGDANSATAYAMLQITADHKVFHIVAGAHTDPITGKDCKWNVFRVCNTTSMDANAVSGELIKSFGKKWYFITPDYAYGHTLQAAFVKNLKAAGGEYQGDMLPLNATDYSASLIKARAYRPNVLLNNMAGLAQVNCMKQFVQFGMDKDMALGGALFELESMMSVPPQALTGWWNFEWWWKQPGVASAAAFNAAIKKATGRPAATARHWFGWVAVHSFALAAEKAKSVDAVKLAKTLEGEELPDRVKCQRGKVHYRSGDHQLMADIFVGQPHPPKGDNPADLVDVKAIVPGEQVALSPAESGCRLTWPSA